MEKRDELWPRGPCFYYDTALFPPGTDSFCLAYFARPSRSDTVCDLGSGIGLLGTLLLARQESLFIENVEISTRQRLRERRSPKTAGRTEPLSTKATFAMSPSCRKPAASTM
ncbi:MAG: hypothetical protein ACLUPM_02770 [Oscillibacter sp.]